MRTTVFASLNCALALTPLVSAFAIRDGPILNSTTPQPGAPGAPPQPTLSLDSSSDALSSTRIESHTAFKPKFETTVSGWEDGLNPSASKNERPLESSIDIGDIIASWITAVPSIHYESSATGFDVPHTRDPEQAPERFERTATDFIGEDKVTKDHVQDPVITPPPKNPPPAIVNSKTLTPVPITSVVIDGHTLTPGGQTETFYGGPDPTQVYLDPSGRPVVVVGESTSTVLPSTVIDGKTIVAGDAPVTIGSNFQATTYSIDPAGQTVAIHEGITSTLGVASTQVFTVGSVTATAQAKDFQYAIGSSKLALGAPITVDGTIISLTTDASGATVLVVGGASTTLQAPLSIPTVVIDGTTQYIIGTETLGPGHPITIDGLVISMMTMSGVTVLVVGDQTTTISAPHTTGFGAVLTTGGVDTGSGDVAFSPTPTSSRGVAAGRKSWDYAALGAGMGIVVLAVG